MNRHRLHQPIYTSAKAAGSQASGLGQAAAWHRKGDVLLSTSLISKNSQKGIGRNWKKKLNPV